MRKKITSLIFFLGTFLFVGAQSGYYAFVDSAEAHIQKADWNGAEEFIKRALSSDKNNPNNSLLLSNLATIQRNQKKNAEALRNYSMALFMTPNAVTLLENRASLYMELDSIDKAYADFAKIISLDATHHESRYYHGIIAMEKKDFATAKSDFESILTDEPKSALGIEGMGLWNKTMANYPEAIKFYDQLVKAKPTAIALSNRAECYLAMKRLSEASKDIQDALAMNAEDGYLYLLRAKLNKLRYEKDDAARDVKLAEKYGIDSKTIDEVLK